MSKRELARERESTTRGEQQKWEDAAATAKERDLFTQKTK
jgi:hypothetical protein